MGGLMAIKDPDAWLQGEEERLEQRFYDAVAAGKATEQARDEYNERFKAALERYEALSEREAKRSSRKKGEGWLARRVVLPIRRVMDAFAGVFREE